MVEGWEMRESEGRKEVGGEGEEGGNKGERERGVGKGKGGGRGGKGDQDIFIWSIRQILGRFCSFKGS